MSSMQPKWNTGHFPTGTVCETEFFEKRTFTVKGISCNGPGSYVLHTDIFNNKGDIDLQSLHINHVSKIIKRSEGKVEIKNPANEIQKRYIEDQKSSGNFVKHKSRYVSFLGINGLVRYVTSKYVTPSMIVDYEKLSESLCKQGVFRSKNISENAEHFHPLYLYSCSKKRLNKTIKQIINKHLMPVKVAMNQGEEYYRELDNNEDIDKISDMINMAIQKQEIGSSFG